MEGETPKAQSRSKLKTSTSFEWYDSTITKICPSTESLLVATFWSSDSTVLRLVQHRTLPVVLQSAMEFVGMYRTAPKCRCVAGQACV